MHFDATKVGPVFSVFYSANFRLPLPPAGVKLRIVGLRVECSTTVLPSPNVMQLFKTVTQQSPLAIRLFKTMTSKAGNSCKGQTLQLIKNNRKSRGQCYKAFFVPNLRIFIISQSVCHWKAFPVQSNKHQLITEIIN